MKTLTDFDRKPLNFRESKVSEVLPEHYLSEYPTLITFLDKYYEFMDSDATFNFASAIHAMYDVRDIEATNVSFIDNILKELGQGILNQNFFLEPRFAMKLVSQFYRVKGSLYSSEGFFRAFFNSEVEISFPKRDLFIVGESEIGFENQKVVQDGALNQILSILVKSEVPVATWRELYKAFVHPAGFFLGAQTLIVGVGDLDVNSMPDNFADSADPLFSATGLASLTGDLEMTGIGIIADSEVRFTIDEQIASYQTMTIEQAAAMYNNIKDTIITDGFTFDEDSAATIPAAMRMSNTVETTDQARNELWDSDSDGYALQIT